MRSLLYKIINIGIVAVLVGITITTYSENAASQTDHHSAPRSTNSQQQRSLTTEEEYIEHFRVPTLTTKEFVVERLLNEGLEKLGEKKYQEALQNFDQALVMNPRHERAYRMRGDLLRQLGEDQKAINDYSQAIKQNPDFSTTYINRGEAYEAVGDYQKAIADYTQAIELYPEDGFGYSYRGAVYTKLGENQKAIADLNKAIEFNPDRPEAYLYRGNFYRNLASSKKASSNREETASPYQKATADYQQAARLFSEQGSKADAEEVMAILQAFKQRSVLTPTSR